MEVTSPNPKVETNVSLYTIEVLYLQGYWQMMCYWVQRVMTILNFDPRRQP